MPFRFDERLLHDYHAHGYAVFRGIVPPPLLRDLRREADKARALAHELNGPQSQRLQPVSKYAERLDQKPFQDYLDLPALRDAITRLLGPDYTTGQLDVMGILIEPRDHPWTVGWHRDGVVEVPPEAYDEPLRAKLAEVWHDMRDWNQVNCALYSDSCTWFVPGSHLRQRDLPGERQSTGDQAFAKHVESLPPEEAERFCLEHCESFPGAVQMHLAAGDYMVYRNLAWHNGNYLPYQPRATLHDVCMFRGEGNRWWPGWRETKKEALERMAKKPGSNAGAPG